MNDEILLPCPFCGGEPVLLPYYSKHRGKRVEGLTIKCRSCVIRKDQLTLKYGIDWLRAHMIADWNKRVVPEADEELYGQDYEDNMRKAEQELNVFDDDLPLCSECGAQHFDFEACDFGHEDDYANDNPDPIHNPPWTRSI